MIKQLKYILCLLVTVFVINNTVAQIIVDNTFPNNSPSSLVQDVLLGIGVTVTNVTFNGNSAFQIGYFDGSACNVGLSAGIIMSSGDVNEAVGPNDQSGATGTIPASASYDPDLLAILAGSSANDAAILEFDFVATGDTVMFNYVFGSDEYLEFVFSFNDAFGFFISGPGIAGPYSNGAENIAVVPNTTTPVTIDNVNDMINSAYYVNNGDGFSPPQSTDPTVVQCDGFTTVLQAMSPVQCGQTYHIKMAICDANDNVLDSWVFLEAGSFQSNTVVISSNVSIDGNDSVLYEGCGLAMLDLIRNEAVDSVTVFFNVTGTATNGIDFDSIPDSLTFSVGQETAQIQITAFIDGLSEGLEYITIQLIQDICGVSDTQMISFYIADYDSLITSTSDTTTYSCWGSVPIWVEVSANSPPHYTQWSTSETTDTINVPTDSTTTYYVTVTDTCSLFVNNDSVIVTILVAPGIPLIMSDDDTLCDLNTVQIEGLVDSTGIYTYTWDNGSSLSDSTIFNPYAFPALSTTYNITVFSPITGCDTTGSVTILVTQPSTLSLVPGDTTLCEGQSVQFNVGSTPVSCGLNITGCVGSSMDYDVGTGSLSTATTSPYYGFYEDEREQILYRASELQALGLTGGTITKIAFNVSLKGSTQPYQNFTIKMGCTALNDLSGGSFISGLDVVYSPASVTVAPGWNTHTLSDPYDWDGVSNLLVEVCFNNGSWTSNDEIYYTTTSYTSVLHEYTDGNTTTCAFSSPYMYDNRPNTKFSFCNTSALDDFDLLWTPSTYLSNDTIADPIATPLSATTYTLTVTHNVTGCQYSETQTINLVPGFGITAFPEDTAVCLSETVQFNVIPDTAGSFTYEWSPATFLDDPFISNPLATMDAPGTFIYIVTANNFGGCLMTDSVTVLVGPRSAPIVTTSSFPDTVCSNNGEQVQLSLLLTDSTIFSTIEDDFDPDIDLSMWSTISGGVANTDCGSVSGNALHFNAVPREAITNAINATSCTTIDFCLIIGSGVAPCEDADSGEDIDLEYSTD
ncbi:MAG: choice-of-anchor L domain-containing protein, partial [Bacteroidota bacterium]